MSFNRPGQNNGSGDAKALFLKVYAGEVLTSFREQCVVLDKHTVRTIESGSSAQFPAVGKASAKYMQAGDVLDGGQIKHAERVITIDDLLVSDVMIYNLDDAMNHYEVRSEYTSQTGFALANQMDKHVLQMGILAARNTDDIAGQPGGGSAIVDLSGTTPQEQGRAIAAAMFEAAATFDEKDIPEGERYFYIRPRDYYKIVQSLDAINSDFGGLGAYSDGKVVKVAGLTLVKANHLPTTNITTGVEAGTGGKYKGDFSNTVGLAMHKSAVGTVKLLDVSTESEYLIERQGHLTVAKYAVGHGILRAAAAFEVKTAGV